MPIPKPEPIPIPPIPTPVPDEYTIEITDEYDTALHDHHVYMIVVGGLHTFFLTFDSEVDDETIMATMQDIWQNFQDSQQAAADAAALEAQMVTIQVYANQVDAALAAAAEIDPPDPPDPADITNIVPDIHTDIIIKPDGPVHIEPINPDVVVSD